MVVRIMHGQGERRQPVTRENPAKHASNGEARLIFAAARAEDRWGRLAEESGEGDEPARAAVGAVRVWKRVGLAREEVEVAPGVGG